jgi:predicted aspartyl protease
MKTKLTFVGLLVQAGLLVSSGPAHAGTRVVNPGDAGSTEHGRHIPLKIYRNFLVVAEGQIDGTPERQNFILDTGTAPSVINQKLVTQLGLRTVPSSTLALGTQVSARASTIPEIELGPIRASSLSVLVKDLSRLEHDIGIPIAGIIGMDVLSKSNFRLDYEMREIEFGDVSHEGVPVHFDARAGIAVADVKLGGKSVRMLVDTGSELVVLLGGNFGEAGWLALRNTSQSGVSLADQKMRVQEFSAPDIILGGQHFSKDTAYFVPGSADPVFDGLLGVRALGFCSLSYDRSFGTIYLQ